MKLTDSTGLKFLVITFTFGIVYAINNVLTPWLLLVPGAHLVHIPSGIKLVLVILFEKMGACSIAVVSLVAGVLFYFPGQYFLNFELALVNALAPYWAVALFTYAKGIDGWIQSLTSQKIMAIALLYSMLNSALNQLVFYWNHLTADILSGLTVMFVGDVTGVLIVIMLLRIAGRLLKRRSSL
jgi:hypothetical protein